MEEKGFVIRRWSDGMFYSYVGWQPSIRGATFFASREEANGLAATFPQRLKFQIYAVTMLSFPDTGEDEFNA